MAARARAKAADEELSHNLVGQKLGKKGRDTRERILAATGRLLAGPGDVPISLSAVAREASLGMTTLYLYFTDLTELLVAVLDPIMASAEESYTAELRTRWSDETLAEDCLHFVKDYHAFWVRHTRVLHLRNSYADANDARMREHRIRSSQPLIQLLLFQMDGDASMSRSPISAMATVLLTGIERMITVATDVNFLSLEIADRDVHIGNLLAAEARLLELGLRDSRATVAALKTKG